MSRSVRSPAGELPRVSGARAPVEPDEAVAARVVGDPADVIGRAQHLGGGEASRIDPEDDRGLVGAVLGHRHPQVPAVVVQTARVVDVRAVINAPVGEQVALAVERDQVADPLAGRAIGTVDDRARRLIALRRLDHLDGREHIAVTEPHHALGVVSVKAQRDLLDKLPAGRARKLGERARDPVALRRRRWRQIRRTMARAGRWCGDQRDRQKSADQGAQAIREHALGVPRCDRDLSALLPRARRSAGRPGSGRPRSPRYWNRKNARCWRPSSRVTTTSRHVPAHSRSVFQGYV